MYVFIYAAYSAGHHSFMCTAAQLRVNTDLDMIKNRRKTEKTPSNSSTERQPMSMTEMNARKRNK